MIHLDSKVTRNMHLLSKMLELEEPTITAKMIDFLMMDGVCEQLLSYITQVGKCLLHSCSLIIRSYTLTH